MKQCNIKGIMIYCSLLFYINIYIYTYITVYLIYLLNVHHAVMPMSHIFRLHSLVGVALKCTRLGFRAPVRDGDAPNCHHGADLRDCANSLLFDCCCSTKTTLVHINIRYLLD